MATWSTDAARSLSAVALLSCVGLGALSPRDPGNLDPANRAGNRSAEFPRAAVSSDAQRPALGEPVDTGSRDFERALRQQATTDRAWREASEGFMRLDKITYRSRVGDLDIPAFVFQPLTSAAVRTQPAIVWVHENIRGHLFEHFIPYVREAVSRGFVVIAPEYRGSIGYGQALFDAIDYGGAEVDDVVRAVGILRARYASVDPARIGVIGWSHGGLIALLGVFRNPTSFKAAAAIVPVTNLFHRMAWKGEDQLRASIDPHNRMGGLPSERRQVYRDRSPLFHVDQLKIPLLVHIAENDEDVNIEEAQPLVDALRARKPELAETRVYRSPAGGHLFDRLVDLRTLTPENSPEQVDSWNRVWAFFERQLAPRR
jgi:dipeptidyl aminopeptidase/acylaminoacyl peptidase